MTALVLEQGQPVIGHHAGLEAAGDEPAIVLCLERRDMPIGDDVIVLVEHHPPCLRMVLEDDGPLLGRSLVARILAAQSQPLKTTMDSLPQPVQRMARRGIDGRHLIDVQLDEMFQEIHPIPTPAHDVVVAAHPIGRQQPACAFDDFADVAVAGDFEIFQLADGNEVVRQLVGWNFGAIDQDRQDLESVLLAQIQRGFELATDEIMSAVETVLGVPLRADQRDHHLARLQLAHDLGDDLVARLGNIDVEENLFLRKCRFQCLVKPSRNRPGIVAPIADEDTLRHKSAAPSAFLGLPGNDLALELGNQRRGDEAEDADHHDPTNMVSTWNSSQEFQIM